MKIAVVGDSEFTLGFRLAGVEDIHNSTNPEEMTDVLRDLLKGGDVGIIVVDSDEMLQLPERLRKKLSDSISPTVLGIGTQEDNTLRDTIRKAIGVDLWK